MKVTTTHKDKDGNVIPAQLLRKVQLLRKISQVTAS